LNGARILGERERRRRRMFLKLTRSALRALKFSLRVSTKHGRERIEGACSSSFGVSGCKWEEE